MSVHLHISQDSPVQTSMRSIDPLADPLWGELVERSPEATIFHTPEWMRVVKATFGVGMAACLLEKDGRVVGGVPWSDIDDFSGRRRVTLAYSDFCDILAPGQEERELLAERVARADGPWTLRTLAKFAPRITVPATSTTLFKWHTIDLTPDEGTLWSNLASMTQRGIRKAERSGVTVHTAATKEELREWFLLHLQTRKYRHNLLAQPYSFFENIWDAYIPSGRGFLLLAAHEGKIIAGTMYLLWRDTCYYKFNASDGESLAVRPNNVLMWQGILEAKRRGYRLFDLGRSNAQQTGLVTFKESFGARPEDLLAITFQSGDPWAAQRKEAQGLFKELTNLFADPAVPDEVSERAGALLYRFFT
jgi:CelD/BcsL family acetyltransferase involved in cellulose biosynthesis